MRVVVVAIAIAGVSVSVSVSVSQIRKRGATKGEEGIGGRKKRATAPAAVMMAPDRLPTGRTVPNPGRDAVTTTAQRKTAVAVAVGAVVVVVVVVVLVVVIVSEVTARMLVRRENPGTAPCVS